MAVAALNSFPSTHEAGDTLRVEVGYSDFPATLWTAELKIATTGTRPTSVTGTASGTKFIFLLTAQQSAVMTAGVHGYSVKVTETASGEIQTAETGIIRFLANLGASLTLTTAGTQLAAANAALTILLAQPNSNVSFNGQNFTKENQSALLDIISRLETKVASEQSTEDGYRGVSRSRMIRPRFV